MALAEKHKGSGAVTTVFIGDGTLGQGVVYESMNMASLWSLPLLVVLENNHIAQTTPTDLVLSGSIPARFEAFGVKASELDTSDVLLIRDAAEKILAEVRAANRPQALILNTVRFAAHSKGDDTRDTAEVERLKVTRDPLNISAERLAADELNDLQREIDNEVQTAFQTALIDPLPSLEEAR
jgi:TPP-dependent pyruvate/acetoin dehydrogenase alpha subunit